MCACVCVCVCVCAGVCMRACVLVVVVVVFVILNAFKLLTQSASNPPIPPNRVCDCGQVYGATVAQVTTHFCWPQRGPVHLYLRVGIFTHCPVPDHPESVFCHVPLRNIPKGIDNASYLAASHRWGTILMSVSLYFCCCCRHRRCCCFCCCCCC